MKVELPDFLWEQNPSCQKLLAAKENNRQEIIGAEDELRILLSAALCEKKGKPLLYLTPSEDRGKKLFRLARNFFPAEAVGYYPQKELLPYDSFSENRELIQERIIVMQGLLSKKSFFAVAPVTALSRYLMPPNLWQGYTRSLKVGDTIAIKDLIEELLLLGYRRDSLTEETGMFSVRGSIVDIFPVGTSYPFRLDFFDDEIEALRYFNPEDQISLGESDTVTVTPVNEWIMPPQKTEEVTAALSLEGEARYQKLHGQKKKNCMNKVAALLQGLKESSTAEFMSQLLPYFYKENATLLSYLGDGLLVLDEGADMRSTLTEEEEERIAFYKELLLDGEVLPSYMANFTDTSEVFGALNRRSFLHFAFLQAPTGLDIQGELPLPARDFSFYREREERGYELRELKEKGELCFCAAEEKALEQMAAFAATWEVENPRLSLLPLSRSMEWTVPNAFLLSERDFFGIVKPPEQKKGKKHANAITSFVDLKEGDYVVHDTHGIGQFLGMERLTVEDVTRDYLIIRYQGKDKLYIPTEQMDLLQKYIGNGEASPKINKLGGKEWKVTKAKARTSVHEMAEDLLKLYAARAAEKGHAFGADSPWQWEMEADFPYEETEDQLHAIADIKKDMEQEKPMDRLLCGDVGYGKTEVALRAAFKAVLDGKQCAVLVPTTVLAQQHERTFMERLQKFGVTVRALSRFKSQKEIKETKKGLENGSVDVVIGTHMLFGKTIRFKDLGLLVIDEEQRFGVAHKEKIKALKKNIDVLAMSATPIPRTLHMSLLGARDISIIETPPARRQPVRTYVMEYRERILKEAILREMTRGGQVYFIHNRVEDIHAVAEHLQKLIPDARVLVGHGQMAEKELEKVMVDFVNGEGDILLCTTIVESGLDFPNVNTLIVDEGNRLGLAQMYQLRGRVGRSRKQGYAYFFYQKNGLLAMPARKRLSAIRDFTDLGSGFKIALRDMEIRGAGNILGPEQHGHLASVGFDMYCRLVKEEVEKLQGHEVAPEKAEVEINVACSAYLPDAYIGDSDVKIELYKKIADLGSQQELNELLEEMEDRFGSIPDSVYHLFLVARVKLLAEALNIRSVFQEKDCFKVVFRGLNVLSSAEIKGLMQQFGKRFSFKMNEDLEMTVKCGKLSNEKALLFFIKVLVFLKKSRETQKNV